VNDLPVAGQSRAAARPQAGSPSPVQMTKEIRDFPACQSILSCLPVDVIIYLR